MHITENAMAYNGFGIGSFAIVHQHDLPLTIHNTWSDDANKNIGTHRLIHIIFYALQLTAK